MLFRSRIHHRGSAHARVIPVHLLLRLSRAARACSPCAVGATHGTVGQRAGVGALPRVGSAPVLHVAGAFTSPAGSRFSRNCGRGPGRRNRARPGHSSGVGALPRTSTLSRGATALERRRSHGLLARIRLREPTGQPLPGRRGSADLRASLPIGRATALASRPGHRSGRLPASRLAESDRRACRGRPLSRRSRTCLRWVPDHPDAG